jgi:hypothetical protein
MKPARGCAVLAMALVPLASPRALAQAPSSRPSAKPARVVLALPACDTPPLDVSSFVSALRVELAEYGIGSVDVADRASPVAQDSALARVVIRAACGATARELTIDVDDAATSKLAQKTIPLDDVEMTARPRAVALAVAELLRASWTEMPTSPPDDPRASSGMPTSVPPVGPSAATPAANKVREITWRAGAGYELHRPLSQQSPSGAPKLEQSLLLRAAFAVRHDDEIALGAALDKIELADQGESSIRALDPWLSYAHTFALPAKFALTTGAIVTAPVSYLAQFAGNITAPGIWMTGAHLFGDFFSLQLSIFARYYWDKYTSSAALSGETSLSGGGLASPISKYSVGGSLGAECTLPFYRLVSVGVSFLSVYSWAYDVTQCPAGSICSSTPNIPSGPQQQNGGPDAHIQFTPPSLGHIHASGVAGIGNTTAWLARVNGGIPLVYVSNSDSVDAYVAIGVEYTSD